MAEGKAPFLSVITAAYNAVETLPQTIGSVAAQADDKLEHIVVDGASNDGTVAYLKGLNNPHLRWVSEPDDGIYAAMNKGLHMARGQVVAFLNADDVWFGDTAEQVARAFSDDVDIVYGNLRKERFLAGRWYHRYARPNLDLMPRNMGIFHPATFIRRSLFERLGPYDERYRFSADYDWLLRAYLADCKFRHVDAPLAIFRVGGVSALNCRSYEEGVEILKQHNTGYAGEMKELLALCRRNVAKRRLMFKLAHMTGAMPLLEWRMAKKWTPNDGDFGA